MSEMGLALQFDRSGGKLMSEAIAKVDVQKQHHKTIIEEIRQLWDLWDAREEGQNDDRLEFDSFYHGFLAPYFGCYRCKGTKKALQAIDMDNNGYVDWNEFMVYIKWALHQYPDLMEHSRRGPGSGVPEWPGARHARREDQKSR